MLIQTYQCYKLYNDTFFRFFYDSYGDNADTVILCLHGIGNNASMFSSLASALSVKYKVITVDLLGHGRSNRSGSYSVDSYCDDVVRILNLCSFKQLFLIGNGIGCMVIKKLASVRNSPVTGFVWDTLDSKLDHDLFKQAHKETNFDNILTKLNISNSERMKYMNYMVNNFNIHTNEIQPNYDYQAFAHVNFADIENMKILLSDLHQFHVPGMVIVNNHNTVRCSKDIILQKTEDLCRIEYSGNEIERIFEWINRNVLTEKERVKNLLGIDTGKYLEHLTQAN